ncbi:MAG: hypothetical protein ILP18_03975 [Treponema sp.]|nr:hypothetical protein [Treponema sp.]
MTFFPVEHEEYEIFPQSPEEVVGRLKKIADGKLCTGIFFSSMFTLKPISCIGMLVTGYFSVDGKRMVLDYLLTKRGKIVWLLEIFLIPIIMLIVYLKLTGGFMPGDSVFFLPMCIFFYILWMLLIISMNHILFRLVKNATHKKILLNSRY